MKMKTKNRITTTITTIVVDKKPDYVKMIKIKPYCNKQNKSIIFKDNILLLFLLL